MSQHAHGMGAIHTAIQEMWAEFAIGMAVLLLRIFTRCTIVVGWRWQPDDYLAIAAIVLFTVL